MQKQPHKKVCGVGINDYDGVVKINNTVIWEYELWRGMLRRCYDRVAQQKRPCYQKVTVDEHWLSFSNFYQDIHSLSNFDKHLVGWQLDKDILVKGNKVYSKATCCFVPIEINVLFTKRKALRGNLPIGVSLANKSKVNPYRAYLMRDGNQQYLGRFPTPEQAFQAYKLAKESYIKEVADRFKHQLAPNVYHALCDYTVAITD